MENDTSNPVRRFFDAKPVLFSLVLVGVYLLWFTLPPMLKSVVPGEGNGVDDMASMAVQLMPELGLVVSVLLVVAILRGWREMRVSTALNPGWHWAVIPVALYISVFFYSGYSIMHDAGVPISDLPLQIFGPLIITTILVGVFEEFLFRGVVFRAFEKSRGPIAAVFISSVLFGSMHYVNWVSGQSLSSTHWQVLHAILAGLLYVGIMLKTGSIWPSVFLHGAWDSTVTFVGTAKMFGEESAATETGSQLVQGIVYGFEPAFGLLLIYLWWRGKTTTTP